MAQQHGHSRHGCRRRYRRVSRFIRRYVPNVATGRYLVRGSLPGAPACRSHPAHNRTCTRLCLIVHIPAVFRPQPSKAGLNVSAGSRRAYGAQVLCSQTSCVWSNDLHGAGGTRGDESALPLALSGARSCPLAQPSEIALIERPLAAAVEALDHQLRLLLGEG